MIVMHSACHNQCASKCSVCPRCMLVGLQNESNLSLTCNLINCNLSLTPLCTLVQSNPDRTSSNKSYFNVVSAPESHNNKIRRQVPMYLFCPCCKIFTSNGTNQNRTQKQHLHRDFVFSKRISFHCWQSWCCFQVQSEPLKPMWPLKAQIYVNQIYEVLLLIHSLLLFHTTFNPFLKL